ncbi:MAG TPA: hypothetical protein PK722_06665, partial [Kiritimatiellia bacterium]|nr:hypothetical protein [Kiritimatiellia bacterium]
TASFIRKTAFRFSGAMCSTLKLEREIHMLAGIRIESSEGKHAQENIGGTEPGMEGAAGSSKRNKIAAPEGSFSAAS